MEKVSSPTRMATISLPAARLAIGSGAATLVLLAVLHILNPEFDPARRMVSEYALGRYGWVLSMMFLAWALSTVTLFFALGPHIQTVGGKLGLGLLLLSAIGMVMAAVFDIRHSLHGLATLLGNFPFVVAAVLTSFSLVRSQDGRPARRSLLWMANLPWISLIVMAASVFIGLANNGGQFGAEMLIGWPNRLVILAYCAWIMTAARWTIGLDQ